MGILRTDKISGLETPTAVTGSVLFDGTGDLLTISSTSDFAFGTGDFTIEMWVYHTDLTGQQTYFGDTYGSTAGIYTYKTSDNQISLYDTSQRSVSAANVIRLNTWYHVAWTRASGTLRAFLDGVKVDEDTYTGDFTTTQYYVGDTAGTSSGEMFGYISNLRVLKGTALYTANFTVPTHELEVIGDTVLLCCNNPDSAGADGTGKTITASGDAAASTFSPGLTKDFTFGTEFKGVTTFDTQGYFVPPSGTTTERDPHGGHRGLFIAGSSTNTIEFVTISTGSNASSFGDTSGGTTASAACSSSTRGVSAGGLASPVMSDTIEYVTIASLGNTIDFGNLTVARRNLGAASNSTRGLFFGGDSPSDSDVIDYITISSTGNALDFGNLSTAVANIYGCASPTRGILGGGESPTILNTIEYVTIASTGNAQDFGDLFQTRSRFTSTGSGTRGVFAAGRTPTNVNTIDYVTIASTGDAQDFGDASQAKENPAATSDSVRGVIAGGYVAPANVNLIEFITISAMGNAQDFGDLISARREFGACSSGHGGLS